MARKPEVCRCQCLFHHAIKTIRNRRLLVCSPSLPGLMSCFMWDAKVVTCGGRSHHLSIISETHKHRSATLYFNTHSKSVTTTFSETKKQ